MPQILHPLCESHSSDDSLRVQTELKQSPQSPGNECCHPHQLLSQQKTVEFWRGVEM